MKVFIPSRDRACQLNLLIRSLGENLSNINFDLTVLYKTSNIDYDTGYNILINENFPSNIKKLTLVKEEDFCKQFKQYATRDDSEHILLLTDDCVIYRKSTITEKNIAEKFNDDKVLCFSFRLGLNTVVQNYITGEMQPQLEPKHVGETIIWNRNLYPKLSNYNYWFSWDGHVYMCEWLYNIVKDMQFENPRALEHQLNTQLSPDKRYICAELTSSLFVNTINKVQGNDGPPAGTKYYYSPEELNERYLAGERIDVNTFNEVLMHSCHSEVPLKFRRVE